MKRRTKVVALATSLLVGVSMTGVGFASWVISNSVESKASGNVTAEAVAVADVTLTATATGDINFGAPKEMENDSAWLTNTEAEGKEALVATFTLTMKGVNHVDTQFFVNNEETPSANSANWNRATTELNLVNASVTYAETTVSEPDGNEDGSSVYQIDSASGAITLEGALDQSKTYKYSFTVTFAWGSHFNAQNPYTYYNAQSASGTRSDSAYGYQDSIDSKTTFDNGKFESAPSDTVAYQEDAWASLNILEYLLKDQKYHFTFTGYSQAEAE